MCFTRNSVPRFFAHKFPCTEQLSGILELFSDEPNGYDTTEATRAARIVCQTFRCFTALGSAWVVNTFPQSSFVRPYVIHMMVWYSFICFVCIIHQIPSCTALVKFLLSTCFADCAIFFSNLSLTSVICSDSRLFRPTSICWAITHLIFVQPRVRGLGVLSPIYLVWYLLSALCLHHILKYTDCRRAWGRSRCGRASSAYASSAITKPRRNQD